ncbi:MAG: hypothetical protein IT371_08905 [Deltaproteobacteria bacterium]|nr:hypothetical protein [Deltaproteobacteria bacterium]
MDVPIRRAILLALALWTVACPGTSGYLPPDRGGSDWGPHFGDASGLADATDDLARGDGSASDGRRADGPRADGPASDGRPVDAGDGPRPSGDLRAPDGPSPVGDKGPPKTDADPCASLTCGAHAACTLGACGCLSGYGNCDGNFATNGCEVQLGSNAHCARCGDTCTGGATCQSGGCRCSGSQKLCGATCTTLGTDENCGDCGDRCTGSKRCQNGQCKTICAPDQCWTGADCHLGATDAHCGKNGDTCATCGTAFDGCQCYAGWVCGANRNCCYNAGLGRFC